MSLSDELYHYGIKGMKWGVRRTPEQLGHKNLKGAKTSNLDKWGEDEDHNLLWIAGQSGSGKSTTAVSLAKENDVVIPLDLYAQPVSKEWDRFRNKRFESYLNKTVPKWKKMSYADKIGSNGNMISGSSEYWSTVDAFRNAIVSFSKKEFKLGNRVIAEGIQIADDWLSPNKDFYSDQPMIILNTGAVTSMQRAFKRDGRGNLISGLKSLDSAKNHIKWYADSEKQLNDLAVKTQAKKGQKWVKEYLKTLERS